MKNILCLLLLLSLPYSSFAGPRVIGGGGDVYALQFIAIADKILTHLQNSPIKEIQIEDLKNAIETTIVESTNRKLLLKGIPKDAINYPESKRIIFNQTRWRQIADEDKPALVLHEYLGILGIEDASYRFSKEILGDFHLFTNIIKGSDSAWYLCSNNSLVVNFFEHRAGAGTRETDITLIFGGYTFLGILDDSYSGPVTLTNPNYADASFIGDVAIDFRNSTFKVKGILNLHSGILQVDTKLNCQEKSGR